MTASARHRACALAALAALAACGKKAATAAPELTGLAALPASSQVVIAADVARVASSPLVARAIEQLLARDATLAERWQKLRETCKLDLGAKLKRLVIAVGAHAGPQPGTGPVVLVATGQLAEAELSACVRGMVGQGGGTLTATTTAGRTLYHAQDGARTMYFAFARADTVVLGADQAFVTDALGAGKKLLDDPDMKRWLGLVDQNAPVWAVGRVDERVRGGLVKLTKGELTSGPVAITIAFDPGSGAKLDIGAIMVSAADAKALESFAKEQLGLLSMAAQMKGLGKVISNIKVGADRDVVRFHAALAIDDINQLISALDGDGSAAQDSPPATGSGSGK